MSTSSWLHVVTSRVFTYIFEYNCERSNLHIFHVRTGIPSKFWHNNIFGDRGVLLIHRSSVKLRDVASGNWTTNLQIVGLHGY